MVESSHENEKTILLFDTVPISDTTGNPELERLELQTSCQGGGVWDKIIMSPPPPPPLTCKRQFFLWGQNSFPTGKRPQGGLEPLPELQESTHLTTVPQCLTVHCKTK